MRSIRWFTAVAACAALLCSLPTLGQTAQSITTVQTHATHDDRSFVDLDQDAQSTGFSTFARTNAAAKTPALEQPGCRLPLYASGLGAPVSLDVGFATYRIFNPSTNAFDTVSVRAYNGCPTGPLVNVVPGQTLKVHLHNSLPAESTDTCPPNPNHDTPHCFNTVNLHTHGMHVSPSGNSDDVFVSVPPGGSFDYAYQIPRNHPAGTYWYHAHNHGSTAIDVASGMEGVLIVRGNRTVAQRAQNGGIADIDTILHSGRFRVPFREHVFLFQQIEYGCFANASAVAPLADATTFEWICPPGSVGELRNYTHQLTATGDPRPGHHGQFNTTWEISGRYTQINGRVQPVFPSPVTAVPAGEIRRLRLVHGGNRDTINFKIVRANLNALRRGSADTGVETDLDAATARATALLAAKPTKASQAATLDELCNGEVVKQVEIAVDGVTRNAMAEKDVNTLNPGYRSDVLVAFPHPGLYCMIDESADVASTISYRPGAQHVKDRRLLAFARVGRGTDIPDFAPDGVGHSKYWQYVRNTLVDANRDLPADVLADLRQLDTQVFAPYKPIEGPVNVKPPTVFDVTFAGGAVNFVINGKTYDPSRVDYTATLGSTDEWRLTAGPAGPHVFHIHVNPFEIVDILNPRGVSIFEPTGGCTAEELATGDRQYCTLRGVYLDTVFLKPAYTVVMRTHYQDFTGEFVMHCHVLDHEDAGMMQNVSIVSPTAAFISRVAGPLRAAGERMGTWVKRTLDGDSRSDIDLASLAPICRAGAPGTLAAR